MTTAEPTLYAVRNLSDENETCPWICRATSEIDAAHQYLAEFWSAEQYDDGSWHSPTYDGDIDGDDLQIEIVDDSEPTPTTVPGIAGAD